MFRHVPPQPIPRQEFQATVLTHEAVLRMLQFKMFVVSVLTVEIDITIDASIRLFRLAMFNLHMLLPTLPSDESLVAFRTAVRHARLLHPPMFLFRFHRREGLPATLARNLVFLVLRPHMSE